MAPRSKTKRRSPLVESDTEEALRRRGTELLGLILIGIGALGWTILWTYSPDDPSLFSATDAAPTNALGFIGASIADPLHRAFGWAAYGAPLAFTVWGLRLLLHAGENRVLSRAIATPVALVAAAAFAATHVPLASWQHAYGLGGLIGDAALGALLGALPLDAAAALPLVSVALALVFVLTAGYALGLTWPELSGFGRLLGQGSVVVYAGAHSLGGRALGGAAAGARQAATMASEARARRASAAEAPLPRPAGGPIPRFDPAVLREPAAPAPRAARVTPPVVAPFEEEDDDAPDLAPPPLAAPETRVQKPAPKPIAKSVRARSEEEPELALDPKGAPVAWQPPPLSLLQNPSTIVRHHLSTDALEENARMLESVLDDYGVRGEIVAIRPGPVVTMYELEPAAGLKASRVIGLADDIARSMSALACRVSTIPGRSVIGIELPNELREKVLLREIIAAKGFGDSAHALPLALGKDIGGEPVVANLARMPHLLIAGTTGSGKSVAINTMILSLLYRLSPDECRLIMIDPKMLELSVYDGIPHLLSPVVTDPKKAVVALKWVVAEMEDRYRKMSKMGVRNIDGYNARVKDALARGEAFSRTVQVGFDEDTGEPVFETEQIQPQAMAFIVVIVDEMADLMMVAGKEIEACIQRLAQMARASGIHLIMATQRPSVDVITGTIKANFPTRISFQVTSKIDSRTILGEMGAEQLLGQGDMLYMAGGGRITRVHGPFVSDEEVEEVVTHLKSLGVPAYDARVLDGPSDEEEDDIDLVLGLGGNTQSDDALYDAAVAIVAKDRKCSTSYIQRKLAIGYNKAARIVEMMEEQGVVSQSNHVGKREVLVPER
ncbi:DNA translocase FtsK 4TM domain-containing protein [Amaricoccus sp.]|uniref:FtsK/SpoIIIE family DNA translocase n=1 Tax=Amaricoccus sp. TaxID=1872485 RepID=UPI001B599A44|nr:DNA translocase FtsK 4TM domain-containing protein [Amaricoccus sp.]MBP7001050.1 DNA translocase FtsK 4TM domain-containing protein [Amaricoccus sp.]